MLRNHHLTLRAILGLAAFCAAFTALLATPNGAYAGFGSCRADPIVTLSDGTRITLIAEIGTDVSNVQEVRYVVHGPRGTRVTNIEFPEPFPAPEIVEFEDNAPRGTIWSATRVRARGGRADVTVYMDVDGASTSATGRTNQAIRTVISR